MKVWKLFGLAASVLSLAGVVSAQNLLSPGQLSPSPVLTSSAFNAGAAASVVAPKTDIANVETPHDRHMRILWLTSIAAMAAGTAADSYSSWHKQESNSLLASSNGTFGAKGVGIKAGIASAVLVPQVIFRKHKDWHLAFAASNFAEAGIFTGATIHNLQVK